MNAESVTAGPACCAHRFLFNEPRLRLPAEMTVGRNESEFAALSRSRVRPQ